MKTSLKFVSIGLLALVSVTSLTACSQKASNEEVAAQVKAALEQEKAKQTAEAAQATEVASEVAAQVKVALAEEKAKQAAATPAPVHHVRDDDRNEAAAKHTPVKPKPAVQEQAPAMQPVAQAAKPVCANCGVVISVNMVEDAGKGSGLGVVGGGVVGGLLGNQVGAGTGKDLATLAGAIGGAIAGNAIEKNSKKTKHYDIAVRMDDGVERMYHQATDPGFSGGEKVKIENDTVIRK